MHPTEWDALVASMPSPHFLQSHAWGQLKAAYGWKPFYAVWLDDGRFLAADALERLVIDRGRPLAASLLLKRTIMQRGFAARLAVLYAPKGPLLDWADAPLRARVLSDLQGFARARGAIFLKIDPDVLLGRGVPGSETAVEDPLGAGLQDELRRRGWVFSGDQVQFRNTVLIDLAAPEEALLGRMKQKTRYNIRLAEKKGVAVRSGGEADLPLLYRMYAETSVRDGFVIREEGYYLSAWRTFMRAPPGGAQPRAVPLVAEVDGEPVAALFLYMYAGRSYYVYGMSRDAHREKMPNHLLQWEAMRLARAEGCTAYDLWGAPDDFNESDPLWGVFRFKEGLGGIVARTLGAWDYIASPLWYKIYTEVMPRILDAMRFAGRSRTKAATRSL